MFGAGVDFLIEMELEMRMALKSETYARELVREHAKVLGEEAPIGRPIVQLTSRGRELHRYTALPKISLH